MYEELASQSESMKVTSMSDTELRDNVTVEDGQRRACSLPGVELGFEWGNAETAIIHHFWVDPKIRGAGVGTTVVDEAISQLAEIPRIKYVSTSIQAAGGATEHVLRRVGFSDVVSFDHEQYDEQIVEGRARVADLI